MGGASRDSTGLGALERFKHRIFFFIVQSRFNCVRLCDPMDLAVQACLMVGFSRQENWNKLPCPPLVDLPDPGIKPMSLMSPALAGGFFTTSDTWENKSNKISFLFFSLSVISKELHLLMSIMKKS